MKENQFQLIALETPLKAPNVSLQLRRAISIQAEGKKIT